MEELELVIENIVKTKRIGEFFKFVKEKYNAFGYSQRNDCFGNIILRFSIYDRSLSDDVINVRVDWFQNRVEIC